MGVRSEEGMGLSSEKVVSMDFNDQLAEDSRRDDTCGGVKEEDNNSVPLSLLLSIGGNSN